MKKILLLITLCVSTNNLLLCQTADHIRANPHIYLWGESTGTTFQRADQQALAYLINQISVSVESNFTLLQQEFIDNDGNRYEETYEGVISTYSSAALHNTMRIVISNEPEAHVMRYIRRDELSKIFEQRERKILDFVSQGDLNCKRYRAADALRYYYWALILLKSHPRSGEITYPDHEGVDRLLSTMLHQKINEVFDNLMVSVSDIRQSDNMMLYILEIKYKNQLAQSFDYTYWTGRDWTNIHSARDGLGVVEFPQETELKEIQLRVEYQFVNETAIDNELRDVISQLEEVPFKNASFIVPVDYIIATDEEEEVPEESLPQQGNIESITDAELWNERMQILIQALTSQNHQKARELFTEEGYEMYKQLLDYGRVRILQEPEFTFYRFDDMVICRALPLSFHFQNNNRSFVEDIVFRFNEDMKISSLAFGLGAKAVEDIWANNAWNEYARMVLVNFLENYKTAYALKRIDYIESIFHDDALIITGTVLESGGLPDVRYTSNDLVRYNRFKKADFIRHLKHSFASNEFINIRFEDNYVRKAGWGKEVYGINIKQDYFSSNYGDTGYLFLIVDVDDPDRPMIQVRTWQPGLVDIEEMIDLSNF